MIKAVYTLEDLASRALLDAGAAQPARLAVIGHPIGHSASPRMHQAALDDLSLDLRYIRLDIEPGQLGEAFARMQQLGFLGCNVTVPHKLEAMECCEVHPDARELGAVNTVSFHAGTPLGFNTDGPGFARAVADDFGVELRSLAVAVVGAGGGAGQAIATQCALSGVKKLLLVNRTLDKLTSLAERLRRINPALEITVISFDSHLLSMQCQECDLVVNTSSVGLKAGDPSILTADCLRKAHRVYDTIYQPPVTPLLKLANGLGCQTSNGLSMLVQQGALAFKHWFPGTDPLPVMLRSMNLAKREA